MSVLMSRVPSQQFLEKGPFVHVLPVSEPSTDALSLVAREMYARLARWTFLLCFVRIPSDGCCLIVEEATSGYSNVRSNAALLRKNNILV